MIFISFDYFFKQKKVVKGFDKNFKGRDKVKF